VTKICHLSSVHPPFDKRVFHRECMALAARGYEVVFVVPHTEPDVVDGVTIRPISPGKGYMTRLSQTIWQVYAQARREQATIYHFHDPELMIIGFLLKLQGKKVIYDLHEDTPLQIQSKYWLPKQLRPLLAGLTRISEEVGSQWFDGIVAATPAIARRFNPRKTAIVQNFPRADEFAPDGPMRYSDRPANIIHLGYISKLRGSVEMLKGVLALPAHLQAKLVLVGGMTTKADHDQLKLMPGWDRIIMTGWRPRTELASLLAQARIGLCILHPAPNYLESYPVKLFEYMSAGLPVVASNFPLWEKIINDAGCGLVIDPLDPAQLSASIKWLLDHPQEAEQMGHRGREAVRSHYNWQNEEEKLLAFYHQILTT
jgi:glycosyltransferase involved in cell wall biosynthesis